MPLGHPDAWCAPADPYSTSEPSSVACTGCGPVVAITRDEGARGAPNRVGTCAAPPYRCPLVPDEGVCGSMATHSMPSPSYGDAIAQNGEDVALAVAVAVTLAVAVGVAATVVVAAAAAVITAVAMAVAVAVAEAVAVELYV